MVGPVDAAQGRAPGVRGLGRGEALGAHLVLCASDLDLLTPPVASFRGFVEARGRSPSRLRIVYPQIRVTSRPNWMRIRRIQWSVPGRLGLLTGLAADMLEEVRPPVGARRPSIASPAPASLAMHPCYEPRPCLSRALELCMLSPESYLGPLTPDPFSQPLDRRRRSAEGRPFLITYPDLDRRRKPL